MILLASDVDSDDVNSDEIWHTCTFCRFIPFTPIPICFIPVFILFTCCICNPLHWVTRETREMTGAPIDVVRLAATGVQFLLICKWFTHQIFHGKREISMYRLTMLSLINTIMILKCHN